MLRLHQCAKEEIREAAVWYDKRSPGLGRRFVSAVREALEALEADPTRYSKLETISTDLPIRRVLVAGFPYMVLFEPIDADVFVYAVAHAARRPNYWRQRQRNDSGD